MPTHWKDRLDRIPLLGRVLAVLRGLWTLPVWRQALRHDVEQAQRRLQQLHDDVHDTRQRWDALAISDSLATLARQVDQLGAQQRLQRLDLLAAQRVQLADLERRLSVLQGAAAVPAWGQRAAAEPAAAGSAWPGFDPDLAGQALRVAVADLDPSAMSLITAPDDFPGQEAPSAAMAALCLWHGWAHLAPAAHVSQLQQARQCLAADGWFAVCCPNPENLAVLAHGARQAMPGLVWPEQAQAMAMAAGFAEVRIHRFDHGPLLGDVRPAEPGAEMSSAEASCPAAVQAVLAECRAIAASLSAPRFFWVLARTASPS